MSDGENKWISSFTTCVNTIAKAFENIVVPDLSGIDLTDQVSSKSDPTKNASQNISQFYVSPLTYTTRTTNFTFDTYIPSFPIITTDTPFPVITDNTSGQIYIAPIPPPQPADTVDYLKIIEELKTIIEQTKTNNDGFVKRDTIPAPVKKEKCKCKSCEKFLKRRRPDLE